MPENLEPTAPYGLRTPAMSDARESVHRVHGERGPQLWRQLLTAAGMSGEEADEARPRLLQTMDLADPVTRLCSIALKIRMVTHTQLTAAHALTRG